MSFPTEHRDGDDSSLTTDGVAEPLALGRVTLKADVVERFFSPVLPSV